MLYLVAVFIPQLYFLIKGKWVSFIIHSIIGLIAIILICTMIGAVIGIPLYFVSSVCAVFDLRKQLMNEHATAIAEKMAEKFQQMPPRQ
jgi:UPF0716 family protein affecting phage T7 exclusion